MRLNKKKLLFVCENGKKLNLDTEDRILPDFFSYPKIPLKFRRNSIRPQLRTKGCAGEIRRKFRDDSSEL